MSEIADRINGIRAGTRDELHKRLAVVVVFGIALGYFESALVVYLREIFYPDGFSFPLPYFGFETSALWRRLLLTEVGREAASLVLIFAAAWLFGRNRRQRFAYFITVFAVWDIFYYVWLKVLLDWPASILDWDILFLIPTAWASPVLAPVLISAALLGFAYIILYRDCVGRPVKATLLDWLGFCAGAVIIIALFCIAGQHITEADYNSHFSWSLFGLLLAAAVALFTKCVLKSR